MSVRSAWWAAMLLTPALLAAPADARWRNETRQEYCAETSQRHPRTKTLIFEVPVDAPHGADVCFTYAHRRDDRANKGAVKVRAQLVRQSTPSGPIVLLDRINFGRIQVEQKTAHECAFTGPLLAGDVATFSFKFIGMPRLIVGGEHDLEATFQYSGSVDFRE